MTVSMTEKNLPVKLLASLISSCCIAFVGFILYVRLWGNALWFGTARGGGNSSWVNSGACELVRSAKSQVILKADHATYHKGREEKPHHCDLWEIPPQPKL